MQHAVGGAHLQARPIVLSVALFLLLTLLVIVPASPARAANFTVDNTADLAASGDVSNGLCDAGAGDCTLRAAVQEANGSEGADVITLTAATYTLTIQGATEDGALTGDLDVTEDVTINGAGTGTTIDADALDRVFHVHPGATLTLDNVTITGGAEATGAGIQVEATGALDLDLTTLTANTATGHGGAIYAAGDVTADLVTISGNTAGTTAGDGGGFYSAGGSHAFTSVTFSENGAENGGGIARAGGTVTIGHTILFSNTATVAGTQCFGSVGSADYNVVGAIAGCTFANDTNDQTGTSANLAALADNGGATHTHALNAGSAALDVGGTCSIEDQRGITRGLICDAGAYEAVQINFTPVTASHAESGSQAVNVTLDGSDPHTPITVTVESTGGSASDGTDYTLSGADLTFPVTTTGPQAATVDITVDDINEGTDESAVFGFTSAQGALIGSASTFTLTITDDDGVSQVDILNIAGQAETDGTTPFIFDVTVSPVSASPISLTYSTGPAPTLPADPSEYEAVTDTLVIPALAASATIEIDVYGDDLDEDTERFRVNADGIIGGELVDTFGVGNITDDDDTPVAVADSYNVDEGGTLTVDIANGVVDNDTDGDSGTLTATPGAAPTNHVGVFTLNADGSFTYENNGEVGPDTFTYRASDGVNQSALATVTINVTNLGPTVSIDGPDPLSSPEGTEVSLAATVDDPGGDAPIPNWTVTKNGGPFDAGTGDAFSFTPDDNGAYVVTVDVGDGEGPADTDSMTVNATNVRPVVPAPAGDSIDEGGSFSLSAPFTDVGQAETHTAVVDWGDGTIEDCSVDPGCALNQTDGLSGTVTGTHTYDDNAAHTVTVTVSDGTGSDDGTTTVNVANVAPVVDAPAPATISEGGTYSFAGAFVDPGADTWSAEVDYGDGSGYQALTLSGMTFDLDHLYVDDGVFTVEVCVADDDQGTTPRTDGICESGLVTVSNLAPVLTMREDMELGADLTATLTGITSTSFTDAGIDDDHTATVDWGDGTVGAADVNGDGTITASHTYAIAGELPRTVTVTLTDDGGDFDIGTFQVNVENLDFDLTFIAPSSKNEGKSFSIEGDFADIDRTGTYEVTVDWGDGSAPETIPYTDSGPGSGAFTSALHRFADDSDCVAAPGQCVILVTVDDLGSNDQGALSQTVTIKNRVPKTAIEGPTVSPEGTKFKLFGNPRDVPADALTYQWTVTKDTGDGPAFFKSGAFKNINLKPDDGCATCVYEATYEVTDDDGASTQEVWTIDVTNVAPDAQMLDKSGATLPPVFDGGREGDTVSLQAVFTDPGAADTHTIAWEAKLLDQVIDTGSEARFDFVAPDDGAYFVVLTVTDDDGGVDTPGSPLITVSNAAPKITNVVTDPTPSAGTPVALNVFFEDKGTGDTHTVTVNWGDGSPVDTEANATSPAALSHAFAAGAYRAKVCVADDDGAKKCSRFWYNAGAAPVSVRADFNGDGIEDMAVGVPGENSGKGAVNVFYGSPTGPSVKGDVFLRQGFNGVLGSSERGDEFGATLEHGDFNGDGYDDLVIAAPGEGLGGKSDAGSVNVLYGSAAGLSTSGDQLWTQESNSVADSSQKGDRFGDSLAVGDFNGDAFADLAIGVPGEDVSGTANAGRVQVLFGGPTKLVGGSSQSWHQSVKGTLDTKQRNDRYGTSLAAGDFNRDGFWDLAIGVPGQTVAGKSKAGAVAILPGSVFGLTAEDDQIWHQNQPGINGSAQAVDQFGLVLASGDFNDDRFADLAVGIPLEAVSGRADAGAVSIIYGGATGLSSAGDQLWHEDSVGVGGVAEANDQFGFALATGDAGNDGNDDLLVGIPNQAVGGDVEAGVVALIKGSGSGLTGTGSQRWHEDRNGTPGSAQPGDHLGAAIGFNDVTGDGRDDLMVGIPGQNFAVADAGAVLMVKGAGSGGFTKSGSKWYSQKLTKVAGDGAQSNDQFGGAL